MHAPMLLKHSIGTQSPAFVAKLQAVRSSGPILQSATRWNGKLCEHVSGCPLHVFDCLIHTLGKHRFADELQEARFDILLHANVGGGQHIKAATQGYREQIKAPTAGLA